MRYNLSIKKEIPLILISLLILFSGIRVIYALDPNFNPDPPKAFNLTQDVNFYYNLSATDPENNTPFVFSNDAQSWGFTVFKQDNVTGEINFTPRNNDVAVWTITLIVTDSQEDQDSKLVRFNVSNVNDPPNITQTFPMNQTLTLPENSSPILFDFLATDPDLIHGDNLSNIWLWDGTNYTSNQSWIYQPDFCAAGNYNITLKVWDLEGLTETVEWNLTITNVNRPPTFNTSNPIQNITWPEDTSLINNISLNNYFYELDFLECGEPPVLNYTYSGNQNVTIVINITGNYNVSFYPDPNWYGIEVITFMLSDGLNTTSSNSIVLNVTNVGDIPIIDTIADQIVYAWAPLYLQVNATDNDNDTLRYYDNTSLFDIESFSGLINFTPTYSDVGNFSIEINVSDYLFNTSVIFNLSIINNTQPNIDFIVNQVTEESSEFVITVNASDYDADNLTFATNYSKMLVPTWTDYVSAATFRFTPNQSDVGNHSITVTVWDEHGAPNTTVFGLEVIDINNAPILAPIISPVIVKINTSFVMQLSATDSDLDLLNFTHNASAVDFPSFYMDNYGLLNFTGNASEFGNHSINITVTDATPLPKSDSQIVTFLVTYNRPPIIYPIGIINATEDVPFLYTINASDPDRDAIEFFVNTTMFNVSSAGLINFTPRQADVGLYNISINVTDWDDGWGNTTFLFNISDVNDPPSFEPPLNNLSIWDNILEDIITEIYINAFDEEGSDLIFNVSFLQGSPIFSIVNISSNQSLINFTPTQLQVGNYSVNVSVSDGELIYSEIVNFTVYNVNDQPVILQIYPYGTPISAFTVFGWSNKTLFPNGTWVNASENTTFFFNHTSWDEDNISLIYNWYLDGGIVSYQPFWNYSLNFSSAGTHNITLYVSDGNLSDKIYWDINITNVNRPPQFGIITHKGQDDFYNGTSQNLNISDGIISLDRNGGPYYTQGNYYSSLIDVVEEYDFNYTQVDWSVSTPPATEIYFRTRTSTDKIIWSYWTPWITLSSANSSSITSTPYRYLQYHANFTTNNTAYTSELDALTIYFVISNKTWYDNQDIQEGVWIDLDNYFTDPDGDPLNYSVSGQSVVDVRIDNSTNLVGLYPLESGVDIITFTVFDINGANATSNAIVLTVLESQAEQEIVQSSGGSSSVPVRQPIEQEVESIVNIELIVPRAITVYKNGTVSFIIRLVNNEDETLENINISAEVNNSLVKVSFTKSFFSKIPPHDEIETTMIIHSPNLLGNYEIVIKADVQSPEFSDSAKIILATIEKGETNQTQMDTKVTFTRDFLLSNPECLELNELLKEAQNAINSSEYSKANEILEETLRYCRYLMASKESLQQNAQSKYNIIYRIFGTTSKRRIIIYAVVIALVFSMLIISLLFERSRIARQLKRRNKQLAKKAKKK